MIMLAAVLVLGLPAGAQHSNTPPTVTIVASDPHASETGPDTGTFLFHRSDGTNHGLIVYYMIGGTASNRVDYAGISNAITIPPGSFDARLTITPIDDALAEATETVVLTLHPTPVLGTYQIGTPNSATVFIADNDSTHTNHPPVVHLTHPQDGDVFHAPANIVICTDAIDFDGSIASVEFFAGTNSLGLATNPPFCVRWTNVPPGAYTLTALATDNEGATGHSGPVHIRVIPAGPPVVSIYARDGVAAEGTNFCHWTALTWRTNWWEHDYWHSNWWNSAWCSNTWTHMSSNSCPGTNTATFVVVRNDGTNADLVVHYRVSGTASNGVDYRTLSGQVIIPAGRRTARVVVWPIDDAEPEHTETVVLTLNPSHDYLIGDHHHAQAIIVDNDHPRPHTGPLHDGSFHISLPGINGAAYRIEASSNLVDWTTVSVSGVTDGAIHFADPDAPDNGQRFYRVVPEPTPPTED
jgi:hypothetical protein